MNIIEKFLSSQKKILSDFKGKSKLDTYCYAVLNRMCNKEVKTKMLQIQFNDNYHTLSSSEEVSQSEKELILKDDIHYLK